MKISVFPFEKNKINSWDEIFRNPCPVSLYTFKTGSVFINRKGALNPHHPHDRLVTDEKLEVPILVHWIHHEEMGDFLLDAGLDSSYINDPKGGLRGSSVDEFQLEMHENISYHISKHNINLQMVFLSHLHPDHAAGVRELPKNIPYVISKGEYQEYHPEIHGDFLEGLEELHEIDFSKASEIPPFDHCVDILGDGSLWAILTPGHTPSHISFLTNGLEGPIFLTMDASFIHENLECGVAPSDYTWDVEKAQETLEKIIEFLKRYPQVRVGAGHDVLK
ncbi:MAG: MBL fold metallo-hydrolase [Methanobacteriaceae archaeon]|nr:MBL fold metallo-hydrolase [Methanobacteriaceae archaeon]